MNGGEAPLLSAITFTPLAGALILVLFRTFARNEDAPRIAENARWLALFVSLFTLGLSLFMLSQFDPGEAGFQFQEQAAWLGGGINYRMGVDGVSVLFVILTAFLMPLCIVCSWNAIEERVAEYMIAFLVLETLMLGTFCALDLLLFYLFFEGGLIPMFIIIGVWGGANRIYAAFKFFLYTLLGSLLMLIAIIAMYLYSGQVLPDGPTTDIPTLTNSVAFPADMQTWLWLGFFASFAVKMPMWPVHTWLPDAHVEAPTAGSVILAGILLKLGGYGLLRFSLPMFPNASELFTPLVFALSVIAIVYTSLVAFRQVDVKKLIAYSSVAHMGFVTMGIFAGNAQGVQGAIFQMLSHGVISGALFMCVGVIYDRMHTREIAFYGGLVHRMPIYAIVFMLFTLGNVGLPGTSGFVGEFLTLTGAFQASTWTAFGAAFGLILSAVYALTLYRKVVFGEMTNTRLSGIDDMVLRETTMFLPLVIATLALGLYPSLVTDVTTASVDALVAQYADALAGPAAAPLPVN